MSQQPTTLTRPPVAQRVLDAASLLAAPWVAWFAALIVGPAQGGVPTGAELDYYGDTAPPGYLMCDGASVLREDYPALFAVIGTKCGAADATHFNVPDARGRFARGRDGGAGRDPNAATRTAMNPGGATGDNVGSIQADEFASHAHNIAGDSLMGAGASPRRLRPASFYPAGSDIDTTTTGGAETRPINYYVNRIIKT